MTGIPDDAVAAFIRRTNGTGPLGVEDVRAGLAAALPHLGDALRAAERSRVPTATPEPITVAHGNLSGLQGHSAPTHNPTDTTQED